MALKPKQPFLFRKDIMKALRVISLTLAAALSLTLAGCENGDTASSPDGTTSDAVPVVIDTATKEMRQNDYRGGVMRTYALKDNVLAIMEGMKRNNSVVREDNPNSFWTTSGYQDFVATFLTSPIINDLQWFNEEQTDWNTLVSQMLSVENSFTQYDGEGGFAQKYQSMSVWRNEKDDYEIYGTSGGLRTVDGNYNGSLSYRILYDCDKDWCKAYSTMPLGTSEIEDVTVEMFEYARVKENVFAIQTVQERLLVVLEESDTDMDIRERPIKEFYYSRLSGGMRTNFVPYEPLPEIDDDGNTLHDNVRYNSEMAKYRLFNKEGDFAALYGRNDSMFLEDNVSAIDHSWVFEDGALQQAIIYKEGTLVVTTYNKLSEKYERFIYSIEKAKAELIAEIEAMVNIEGLVGVITEKTDTPAETGEANETGEAEDVADSSNANTSVPTNSTASTSTTDAALTDNTSNTSRPDNLVPPVATSAATSASAGTTTPASTTAPTETIEEGGTE